MGAEVEQETSAPPPKKYRGSAPEIPYFYPYILHFFFLPQSN